jgi:TPR repeat protein
MSRFMRRARRVGVTMTRNVVRDLAIAAIAAVTLLAAVHPTQTIAATTGAADADAPSPDERLKRNQVSAASGIGDANFRQEQAKGLEGDRDAAYRVAQMYKSGSNGVPRDERQMVQWLLHASSLKSGAASYQLYQYYLELKLDRDAVFFENRAIEQGFTPPPRLDPRRG